jgi:hypothetical protein
MFIALNRFARKQQRRLMMLATVLAVCGAVVAAHSVMAGDHMGDGAVMCVAVLQVAAVAAASVARLPRTLLSAGSVRLPHLQPALPVLAFPPEPRARAAPTALQVFRL